jgi:uncharacterized protein (TIGR03118 family)
MRENLMKTQFGLAIGLMLLVSPAVAGETAATAPAGGSFKVMPLDADQKGKAKVVDPNLINPWGLSQSPGGPVWVSDNGTGLSTLYDRTNGQIESLVVTIPQGNPTGTVYVPSNIDFQVTENGTSGPAAFLFDSESGVISGWAPSVDGTNAIVAVNNSASGAVYKGLALDTNSQLLFAANFSQNKVEVYNTQFQLVNTFTDPSLPARYAPFNILDVNGLLYVSFAERDKSGHDEVDGAHKGYVDVFTTSGQLQTSLIAGGFLNAPWGMQIAPTGFGSYSGDLLVGNFGNGWINVYDPTKGTWIATVQGKKGPLTIQGLWALDNGPGTGQVSFSAGPGGEAHGLLGIIEPSK